MPKPVRRNQRYMPGLDGLRAIAVLGVITYHLDFGWATGGLLGVGVFFTLSGYLITDLLLAQWARGGIHFAGFWMARARRLLPALFLMLAVVVVWVCIVDPPKPVNFSGALASGVFYVNNWWLIFQDISYFGRFGPPGPLNHLWSLSVEEQFYIVWPLLLWLGVRYVKEFPYPSGVRFRLAGLTLLLAAASATLMAVLYHPTFDPSRIYDGTDTRAFELLGGAALAMVWPSRRLKPSITARARNILDGIGLAGLGVIGIMFWRTNQYSAFLYQGGFVLLTVATVLLLAALVHPASRLGPALGWAPLRWIGVRSYGIYLWHFPIIVLTTPVGAHGTDLGRDVLQVAAIIAVSALSWRFVEEPIRHGALGRLWAQAKSANWRPAAMPRQAAAALLGVFTVLVVLAAGMAGIGPAPAVDSATLAAGQVGPRTVIAKATGPTGATGAAGRKKGTSCHSVIHIGDSTSLGVNSPAYIPKVSDRISAQYADVGATTQHFEISGARSIIETLGSAPNAYDVAQNWINQGYDGCWVLALGTDDTANVFVGSPTGQLGRIRRMMSAIGDQPVMWVNTKTLLTTGPYADQNMQEWNAALLEACPSYPNMRVFDWASVVQDGWFQSDGTHYTSAGYAERARLIAQALAHAFPASGSGKAPKSCVVQ